VSELRKLQVLLAGRLVGTIAETPNREIFFEYSLEWLRSGFPVSPFYLPLTPGLKQETGGVFGGLFGGQTHDPVKLATDINTAATAQNSAAVATLSYALTTWLCLQPQQQLRRAAAALSALRIAALSQLPADLTRSLFSRVRNGTDGPSAREDMPRVRFTRRQHEVVDLVCEGLQNREIGQRLNISYHTVRSHVCRVLSILALHSRHQLAAWAYNDHGSSEWP